MTHPVNRSSLFCDVALAERIERVEAQLIAETSEAAGRRRADGTGFVIPVAGGIARFAEADSPLNKVTGLGFNGSFDTWLDLVADAHPDTQGVPTHEDFPRDIVVNAMRDMAAAGVRRYAALRDGVVAGAPAC